MPQGPGARTNFVTRNAALPAGSQSDCAAIRRKKVFQQTNRPSNQQTNKRTIKLIAQIVLLLAVVTYAVGQTRAQDDDVDYPVNGSLSVVKPTTSDLSRVRSMQPTAIYITDEEKRQELAGFENNTVCSLEFTDEEGFGYTPDYFFDAYTYGYLIYFTSPGNPSSTIETVEGLEHATSIPAYVKVNLKKNEMEVLGEVESNLVASQDEASTAIQFSVEAKQFVEGETYFMSATHHETARIETYYYVNPMLRVHKKSKVTWKATNKFFDGSSETETGTELIYEPGAYWVSTGGDYTYALIGDNTEDWSPGIVPMPTINLDSSYELEVECEPVEVSCAEVQDVTFEHRSVSTGNWETTTSTVDGNKVKITAEINNIGTDGTFKVDFIDIGSKPERTIGQVTVSIPEGGVETIEYEWDTSGYAWNEDGSPRTDPGILVRLTNVQSAEVCAQEKTSLEILPKLMVKGLEVTQAVQDLNNSVPLVAGKKTFVRAHVKSNGAMLPDVKAYLSSSRGGRLPASNSINVVPDPVRQNLGHSFLFELPTDWTKEGFLNLHFEAEDYETACEDAAGETIACDFWVTFEAVPEPEIRFIGVSWNEGAQQHGPPLIADYFRDTETMRDLFPIAGLDWRVQGSTIPWLQSGRPNLYALLSQIDLMRVLDGCIWPFCNRIYYGLLNSRPEGDATLGIAIRDSYSGVGYVGFDITAHEVGHVLGRQHPGCLEREDNPDPGYPYDPCSIWGKAGMNDWQSREAKFGFNTKTKTVKLPNSGDLMSYAPSRWISDYTYRGLKEAIEAEFGDLNARQSFHASEPGVLVSGFVDVVTGAGRIDALVLLDMPGPLPAPASGRFAVRLENEMGDELATHTFEALQLHDGSEDEAPFLLLVPRPANLARVVLLDGDGELDRRTASANAPTVTVLSPNGGEKLSGSMAEVKWESNDGDGETLAHIVQYSADGGASWETLATAWPGTSYDLDLDLLAGSDAALIRILANDGFHTAQDDSDAPFTVANKPPLAFIRTPQSGELYIGEQLLILEGEIFDIEDGVLEGASAEWTSDLDGSLGEGAALEIEASTLREGRHKLTFSAQDSAGQTGSDSITVDVYRERPNSALYLPMISR